MAEEYTIPFVGTTVDPDDAGESARGIGVGTFLMTLFLLMLAGAGLVTNKVIDMAPVEEEDAGPVGV